VVESVDEYATASVQNIDGYQKKPFYEIAKRVQDFFMAMIAVILLMPVWLIIALIIRLTSEGPVIYKQTQAVGRYGKPFTMYKFRTMYTNLGDAIHRDAVARFMQGEALGMREDNGKKIPVYKLTNDPRVTPIGVLLRKTGLDEAPQFFNVIKGDLSLVGPRPALKYEFEEYTERQKERFLVLPGITGLYQVTARSQVPFEEAIEIDLEYIRRRSFLLDLKIILKTPWVLITGMGAY
jgi:lipopolysaccharide/colanic/teichoic acid biosynthesis glycosyltransferase